MDKKAVLVLNGEIDAVFLENNLDGSTIYCTDGAYNKLLNTSLRIEAIIGDMDSIGDKSSAKAKLVQIEDQNHTDFEKALQYLSDKYSKIEVYGASGGEMDHFIANLSVAKKFKEKLKLTFVDPVYKYYFLDNDTTLENVRDKIISIIPFPKVEKIKTSGLKFELDGNTLELGKLISIRNKAGKENVKITYDDGDAIVFVGHKAADADSMETYYEVCQSRFWQEVFEKEMDYLVKHLKNCNSVLSVGCGPAIIEKQLAELGFAVTGLDVSKEALDKAPDTIRKVIGTAEKMTFPDASFDSVIYVASLQFIENYEQALRETARVLKPKGKVIVMLLNPESLYFKEQTKEKDSYMNKARHLDIGEIETQMEKHFLIESEYYLGIVGEEIFPSSDAKKASLYVIWGHLK